MYHFSTADEPARRRPAINIGESILCRWHGGIYKLVWKQALLYIAVYVTLSAIYEFVLDDAGKSDFEAIAQYCARYTSSMPVILLLGFFTSTAMTRWFMAQTNIPGTGRPISVFCISLKETAPEGTVDKYCRWLLLTWGLTFRLVCKPMRDKYPDLMSLQEDGLLLENERMALEEHEMNGRGGVLPLVVIDWILLLLKQTNRGGHFVNPPDFARNVDLLMNFKKSCGNTIKFASKNIPFALIQAVTITVYCLGLASLMARHFSPNRAVSIMTGYVPLLHAIQYFLYFAWLKFGHAATDPFGYDEDDIDIIKLYRNHIDNARRLKMIFSCKGPEDILPPEEKPQIKSENETCCSELVDTCQNHTVF